MEKKLPRPEYPRPSMKRPEDSWQNLNGEWEFLIDEENTSSEEKMLSEEKYPLKINVPFAPECKLSGIEKTGFMKSVWYRREFEVKNTGVRTLLHFGAVDYIAKVWINGKKAGEHRGGYTPFVLDITKLVKSGINTVTVNAYDDTRSKLQPTGKQAMTLENTGCRYTRTTGIWQTVWIEYVPDVYIESLKLTPDVPNGRLRIRAALGGAKGGAASGMTVCARASLEGVFAGSGAANVTGDTAEFEIVIPSARLWTPDDPALYDIAVSLSADGKKADEVISYFGMRKVEIKGHAIELNGKPYFQRLVLDQGFYPDGIYTAPDVTDMEKDILLSMKAGFNGARLHMKIFEPYTAYYADKLGYILWAEYPNWGLDDSNPAALEAMLGEWLESVERDYNHPSIVGWCPFNETESIRDKYIYPIVKAATKAIDPYRPFIDTSGYVHVPGAADVYDCHNYEQDPEKFASFFEDFKNGAGDPYVNPDDNNAGYEGQPYFVSEYGGTHWDIEVNGIDGWGYGKAPESINEFYDRIEGLTRALTSNPNMCGYCYTQLTDVMQEKNGIYTFDRKEKFDSEKLKSIFGAPAAIEGK